jgi:hypothetical protein
MLPQAAARFTASTDELTARLHESALDRMGAASHVAPLSVARVAASLGSALSRKASTCSGS